MDYIIVALVSAVVAAGVTYWSVRKSTIKAAAAQVAAGVNTAVKDVKGG